MKTIVSIGEILWDEFPDYKLPGGSPANLAYHAGCLGNHARLISKIGKDSDGHKLLQFLKSRKIDTGLIQIDNANPTGRVTVDFSNKEPEYTIHQPSAWDYISWNEEIRNTVKNADAICFATLAQRRSVSASTIKNAIEMTAKNGLKVFDLNLRPPFLDAGTILSCIEKSDVLKMNVDEYRQVSDWLQTPELKSHLLDRNPEQIIILTKGPDGSELISRQGAFTAPAETLNSDNGDFVGVGDAFLAAAVHLLAHGAEHKIIPAKANRYAACVASQKGSMPEIPKNVIRELNSGLNPG